MQKRDTQGRIIRATIKVPEWQEVAEKCSGCSHTIDDTDLNIERCNTYLIPSALWRRGDCPRATHLNKVEETKKKINPIKASKRRGR